MLFHSATFAVFFAVTWALYWALRNHARARLILLTLASWGFYSAWDWRFTGLLLLSTGVDYLCGRQLARSEGSRRRWLWLSLVVNLGVLATFKYLDFFAASTAAVLQSVGLEADWVSLHIVLPVGISFYTFQTLGYTIDVYRGRTQATDDPWQFAAYVAFFPQLVAGPIERASSLLPQLVSTPRLGAADQLEGARRFVVGLWKKMIIADNLGAYVDWVFVIPADQVAPHQVWLGVLAFAGQIWADFSGYTDMALGVARMLGIRLAENFDAPYLARGPRDFWRRWHISLSTWLRDYLYIPLGGNRRGPVRTQINLAVTMVLGGLWHGAAWTFVAWGAFHGLWLALERGVSRLRGAAEREATGLVRASLGVALTFVAVCVGWLLFRAPSLGVAWGFAGVAVQGLGQAASWRDPAAWVDGLYVLHFFAPVVIVQIMRRAMRADDGSATSERTRAYVGWVLAAYALLALFTEPHARPDAPFIYFQF
ncbi:MBOAT family O-acyltransferase [Enhygromyxa salina]|uniref:Peptidoglycan O-acetyltransferase n=1 Tax=Enhygromyxa salina TaxID=215803 RepID=A0A2S9XPJ4_9BACT|nr:MBOAT family protein [Enhygromyxa salina]PRP94789.1 Peptidoglycan O-acetyltransferase [Enhygromyxa salina]